MTYKPHFRLSMIGELGGGREIFSCNLSLVPHTSTFTSIVTGALQLDYLTSLLVDFGGTNWEDMQADVAAFWQRGTSQIHQGAVLKTIKMAAIAEDGTYGAAPLEAAGSWAGGQPSPQAELPPWQVARKITLETDGDLGRVKGGFYLPAPPVNQYTWDSTTGLFDLDTTTGVRDSVVTFLNDLANEPGLDDQDLRPVIASQGRHNKNGSVRQPPTNWEIKRVNVGRRPDIQRRRANARDEARFADSAVSF